MMANNSETLIDSDSLVKFTCGAAKDDIVFLYDMNRWGVRRELEISLDGVKKLRESIITMAAMAVQGNKKLSDSWCHKYLPKRGGVEWMRNTVESLLAATRHPKEWEEGLVSCLDGGKLIRGRVAGAELEKSLQFVTFKSPKRYPRARKTEGVLKLLAKYGRQVETTFAEQATNTTKLSPSVAEDVVAEQVNGVIRQTVQSIFALAIHENSEKWGEGPLSGQLNEVAWMSPNVLQEKGFLRHLSETVLVVLGDILALERKLEDADEYVRVNLLYDSPEVLMSKKDAINFMRQKLDLFCEGCLPLISLIVLSKMSHNGVLINEQSTLVNMLGHLSKGFRLRFFADEANGYVELPLTFCPDSGDISIGNIVNSKFQTEEVQTEVKEKQKSSYSSNRPCIKASEAICQAMKSLQVSEECQLVGNVPVAMRGLTLQQLFQGINVQFRKNGTRRADFLNFTLILAGNSTEEPEELYKTTIIQQSSFQSLLYRRWWWEGAIRDCDGYAIETSFFVGSVVEETLVDGGGNDDLGVSGGGNDARRSEGAEGRERREVLCGDYERRNQMSPELSFGEETFSDSHRDSSPLPNRTRRKLPAVDESSIRMDSHLVDDRRNCSVREELRSEEEEENYTFLTNRVPAKQLQDRAHVKSRGPGRSKVSAAPFSLRRIVEDSEFEDGTHSKSSLLAMVYELLSYIEVSDLELSGKVKLKDGLDAKQENMRLLEILRAELKQFILESPVKTKQATWNKVLQHFLPVVLKDYLVSGPVSFKKRVDEIFVSLRHIFSIWAAGKSLTEIDKDSFKAGKVGPQKYSQFTAFKRSINSVMGRYIGNDGRRHLLKELLSILIEDPDVDPATTKIYDICVSLH